MGSYLSTTKPPLEPEPEIPVILHNVQAPDVNTEQSQGDEDPLVPNDELPHDAFSSSGSVTHVAAEKGEKTVVAMSGVPGPNQGLLAMPDSSDKLLDDVTLSSCPEVPLAVYNNEGVSIATLDAAESNPKCAEPNEGNKGLSGSSDNVSVDVPTSEAHMTVGQDVVSAAPSVCGLIPDYAEGHLEVLHDTYSSPECAEQGQGSEEIPGTSDKLIQDIPSFSNSGECTVENEDMIITSIHATDVSLGLRRIPAGFYVAVYHSGLEWRTEHGYVSVNDNVIRWIGSIPLPSDLSAVVSLGVYAWFEFQPTLGDGEQLRKLTIPVERLLDRSAKQLPFTFFPKDGDVISPCSSVSVTIERRKRKSDDLLRPRVIYPHRSNRKSKDQMESMTNDGHSALSCYRRHGDKRDLDRSIGLFERALDICPQDHPCRGPALANVALAKFIRCQVDDTAHSLDIPLALYRNALASRPVGHPDRPSTLIHLASVHSARFEKRRDEADTAHAEALLREAMNLSTTHSYENQIAMFIRHLHNGRKMAVRAGDQSSMGHHSIAGLVDKDPWLLSAQLIKRFKEFGDLEDLQQAIILLEKCIRSISLWDRLYPTGLTNLSVALLNRFRCLGELNDLEDAIARARTAVEFTTDSHVGRPGRLANLGNALFVRFRQFGQLSDLEGAISRYDVAVNIIPDGHPDKPGCLNDLAISIKARFELLGELSDLEQAISRYKHAISLTPDDHPDKPTILSGIGSAFLARFARLGESSDLEQAILRHRNAVNLTPHHHPDKPLYLNSLAASFKARFERTGEPRDLEQAHLKYREALDLTPDGHLNKPGLLSNLGNTLRARFNYFGHPNDLNQAALAHRAAVDLTPDGHPDRPTFLSGLATTLQTRFDHLGELSDLEQAISVHKKAAELVPPRHLDRPHYLNNLAVSFKARYIRLGDLGDLEQAFSLCTAAVDLTSDDHPGKCSCLATLGDAFGSRYERFGKLSDLEQAILKHTEVVELASYRHPNHRYMGSLANSLMARYERFGELNDLEQAISRYRDALDLTPVGHINRRDHLNDLGSALRARFECLGQLHDVEHAISSLSNVVELTPDGHPSKPTFLNNLGSTFRARFEQLGEPSDVEQAISKHRDAIDLMRDDDINKPKYVNDLANAFVARFQRFGELRDLEEAISRHRLAVSFTPDEHPNKPLCLNNLGGSLRARFQRLGEPSDIEQAISAHREAVKLTPRGHPVRSVCLNSLGNAFRALFERFREPSDLVQAISRHSEAVESASGGHPGRSVFLNDLAHALFVRFESLAQLEDLEHAISKQREAVGLIDDRHTKRSRYLNNLASFLLTRFRRFGELSDLEEAIVRHKDVVELIPVGHPRRPRYLNNLAISLFTRFERLGELDDLEQAILSHRDAVDLIPDGHPQKPTFLYNLGNVLSSRFDRLAEPSDLEEAISLLSCVASTSAAPITIRFRACQIWVSRARISRHHTLLHAYSSAIGLLPQQAWIGLSLTQRYFDLSGGGMVREAAAAALDLGFPETAVEWLEQGRSIVWNEYFQLRSSSDELLSAHPDHAHRFQQLSNALELASFTHEEAFSSALEELTQPAGHQVMESLTVEADRHRKLALEWDKLLEEIRGLPGFERFLLHKEFSQLCASAHSGPVVILNAAKNRCDALIILADVEDVIHVPLPGFTFKRSDGLKNALKILLGHARDRPCDEREGDRDSRRGIKWESVLSVLWSGVVKPVLDSLAFSTPGDLSRIFWCPTGPFAFLPIHAAGLYGMQHSEPGHKVFDFVVSSYIPTLDVLIQSRESNAPFNDSVRLLAVRQPASDGLFRLPGVDTELEYIRAIIPSSRATLLESSVGTVEEVLSLMKNADWVHFACHGVQDSQTPAKSGLCLADRRRLKLSDIVALSRFRGGLAFLSACQTAMGDEDLSDEAVHIAAGMLLAGYGGVIGTMWSISDRLAPQVARDVYGQLFRNGKRPDYREAARALHDAIGRLRDHGASFLEWLPFIHVGL